MSCREILAQLRVHDLEHALGRGQVLEADPAEITQRDLIRQTQADAVDHRLRQQHLAAVCCAHDACAAVDRRAEIVVVTVLDQADMQAAAHLQQHAFGGGRIGEGPQQRQRGVERVHRLLEGGEHAVAEHLHDDAAMGSDRGARQCVMARQRARHHLRLLFPETGTAFDIGEKNRRGLRS